MRIDAQAQAAARASADPWSPWNARDGWRLNEDNHHTFTFQDGEREVAVTAHYRRGGYLLDLPGESLAGARGARRRRDLVADLDGARVHASVVRAGER